MEDVNISHIQCGGSTVYKSPWHGSSAIQVPEQATSHRFHEGPPVIIPGLELTSPPGHARNVEERPKRCGDTKRRLTGPEKPCGGGQVLQMFEDKRADVHLSFIRPGKSAALLPLRSDKSYIHPSLHPYRQTQSQTDTVP